MASIYNVPRFVIQFDASHINTRPPFRHPPSALFDLVVSYLVIYHTSCPKLFDEGSHDRTLTLTIHWLSRHTWTQNLSVTKGVLECIIRTYNSRCIAVQLIPHSLVLKPMSVPDLNVTARYSDRRLGNVFMEEGYNVFYRVTAHDRVTAQKP